VIVVFDTNIFVSALMFPGGQAERAMLRILGGVDSLVSSKDLLDELLTVLARKFGRDREELSRLALWLAEMAQIVTTGRKLKVLADEPDNRVLECAVAGSADAIVTGDKALLALKSFQGIRIISLQAYLSIV
jgi:putative PIN family toxin of toxin-antitoxin system